MAEVQLQQGESLENALRRFKRKVMTEDIIKEIKRHSFYLKPGERRRVKPALAQKRARKKIRKESEQGAQRRFATAKSRVAVAAGESFPIGGCYNRSSRKRIIEEHGDVISGEED